jgi:hypothetical protein
MKSKLLQKINKSNEVFDGHQKNTEDPSEPLEATQNRTTRPRLLTTGPLRKTAHSLVPNL